VSFKKRTATAAFLLVLVFLLFQYASRLVFFLTLQGIILAALVEFYALAEKRKLYPQRVLGLIMALVLSLSFFFPNEFPFMLALFCCFLIQTIYFLLVFTTVEKLPRFSSSIAVTMFGVLYLSFTLGFFYPLRFEWGAYTAYFLFGVIFLGDTGAYLVGRAIGRHKMTPLASPNKTWEGAAAGILTACLAGIIGKMVLVPQISWGKAVVCAFLVMRWPRPATPGILVQAGRGGQGLLPSPARARRISGPCGQPDPGHSLLLLFHHRVLEMRDR
jgi:phosphatidate cytidylyltransferase